MKQSVFTQPGSLPADFNHAPRESGPPQQPDLSERRGHRSFVPAGRCRLDCAARLLQRVSGRPRSGERPSLAMLATVVAIVVKQTSHKDRLKETANRSVS